MMSKYILEEKNTTKKKENLFKAKKGKLHNNIIVNVNLLSIWYIWTNAIYYYKLFIMDL